MNTSHKAFFICIIFFIQNQLCYAQNFAEHLVPKTPETSSLLRFGEYPVSLYTGLVDISIPIYSIKCKESTVPIELKYHASGLKYNDISGEVGLGWTLNAGGVISIEVKGTRDGRTPWFMKDVNFMEVDDCDDPGWDIHNLRNVKNGYSSNSPYANGEKDGEIDLYNFSFMNYSGTFCLPPSESYIDHFAPEKGLFIPANGMQLVKYPNGEEIILRDEKGVTYTFNQIAVSPSLNPTRLEYRLTKLISTDKLDSVTFEYESISQFENHLNIPFINYQFTDENLSYTLHNVLPTRNFHEYGGTFFDKQTPPRISRITFPDGYVKFNYYSPNNIKTWDLREIIIYDNNNNIIQKNELGKSLFSNQEQKLDSIKYIGSNGSEYSYLFDYDGEPNSLISPVRNIGVDYWGYFNGANVPYNKCYTPKFNNMPNNMSGTDRSANESEMKKGMLSKIIYPTKGYSEFEYEANRASTGDATPTIIFGGLRIKTIKNYTANGKLATVKKYVYGFNGNGKGNTNYFPDINDFIINSHIVTIHSTDVLAEHVCAIQNVTSYLFFPKQNYFMNGSPVVYPEVREYISDGENDLSLILYKYEYFQNELLIPYANTYTPYSVDRFLRDNNWKCGNLLSKTIYKKENSQFVAVSTLTNTYKSINEMQFRNLRVLSDYSFGYQLYSGATSSNVDYEATYCHYNAINNSLGNYKTLYNYFNYLTTTGLRVLDSTILIQDGVSEKTLYKTYNKAGFPTKIIHLDSNNDSIISKNKYSSDLDDTIYKDMDSANILSPVIETKTYKNSCLLKSQRYNYQHLYSQFYSPTNYIETSKNGQEIISFDYKYNEKNNITQSSRNNSNNTVYIWSKNYSYPLAKIENTTYDGFINSLSGSEYSFLAHMLGTLPGNPADPMYISFRNILVNAVPNTLVTTYTYKLLVGMTSQTDPRGVTTYYDYDDFNRLKSIYIIEDGQKKILQQYDYHYSNQE